MTRAPGGSTSVYFLPVADTPAPKPLEHQIGNLDLSACLFPPDPEFFAPMLKLSPPVDGQMRDFALALRGFPSHIPGQFWRMIYFSATTITTLGFGDIVPLTTAARMIVALESVVGILLMGLFLNALAAQPRKRPSTDANPE